MDPIRALELWTQAPQLIVSVMDARLAREAFSQANGDRARDMSPGLVDFYVELTELAEGIRTQMDALGEDEEEPDGPEVAPD